MRLFLIVPKWPESSLWGKIYFRFPYLSLTTLASITEDCETVIIDENVEPIYSTPLPDLAAVSIMTPLAKRGYEIADYFRRKDVPVVLGGIHATIMENEAKAHADAVVVGEAETVWPLLLDDFRRGELKPFYRAAGFSSLDRLPFPRRELLKRKAYFFINTIQTTRGCPFDCEFCSVTSFYGQTYRMRPIEEVIREISQMDRGYIFFVDDNIAGNSSYAKEFFRKLIPLNVKWFSQASVRIAKDKELLSLAQKSGCKGLFIGFESLSQENLRALGKSINRVDEFRDAIRTIHDHGIGIQGSFIFGGDEDDKSVFSEVQGFVEKTRLEAALFSILTPFPGTKMYKKFLEEKRIIDSDWEKYDMNHVVFRPKKMKPEELQEGFNSSYRRLYDYRSILTRLFPFGRSGLFFLIQNLGFRQAWKKL
jgi:radical SAM superfamily enzyme YgiQ (UPF0313 family)